MAAHTHDDHAITGPKTYMAILGALLVLTVITVFAAGIDFGRWNLVIAMTIASIKASLVALFFMHLRHDRFNALVFVFGVSFLGIFLIFTLFDIDTRHTILPGNLKAPIEEFPGAPLGKPVTPSTGAAIQEQPAPAPGTPAADAPAAGTPAAAPPAKH